MDESGSLMNRAKVIAEPLDNRPRASIVNTVETDDRGEFVFKNLSLGRYGLFAFKEDAGYPNTSFSFYRRDVFATVDLTSASPAAEVQLKLGPKAGVLTGEITDAETGRALNTAIKLIREDDHNVLSSGESWTYRILIPPLTNTYVEVLAPGYRTYYYGGSEDPLRRVPLNLRSGEQQILNIQMVPARDPNLTSSRFLIPKGYTGWLRLVYDVKDAPPATVENNIRTYEFPRTALLTTSSPGPARGAALSYFYYSDDRQLTPISVSVKGGLIWGEHGVMRGGEDSEFSFFVGSEEQYKAQPPHSAFTGNQE